jgi:hypothetical protein
VDPDSEPEYRFVQSRRPFSSGSDEDTGETTSRTPAFCVVGPKKDRPGRVLDLFLVPAAVVGQSTRFGRWNGGQGVVERRQLGPVKFEVDVSDTLANLLGPGL